MLRATMIGLAGLLLAACQSSQGGESATAGAGLRQQETLQQAIDRIEREGAQQRYGRGQ